MTEQLTNELRDELKGLIDQAEIDLDSDAVDQQRLIAAIQKRMSEKAEELRDREGKALEDADRRSDNAVEARIAIQNRIVKLEGLAAKMQSSIKRLAGQYHELLGIEAQIYELGQVASDWKFESFKHLRFGGATYTYLVHALAAELRLQNQPINGWPSLAKSREKSEPGVAFYGYIDQRIRYDESHEA